MSFGNFISAAFGAVLGGAITFIVSFVKARLHMYSVRYEELCKQISQATDLSSEYWVMNFSEEDALSKEKDVIENFFKSQLLVAKILGLQQQVILLHESLRSELPKKTRTNLSDRIPSFINALTGNEFRARTGLSRLDLSILVQQTAAEIITEIRTGLREKYSFGYLILRAVGQH